MVLASLSDRMTESVPTGDEVARLAIATSECQQGNRILQNEPRINTDQEVKIIFFTAVICVHPCSSVVSRLGSWVLD